MTRFRVPTLATLETALSAELNRHGSWGGVPGAVDLAIAVQEACQLAQASAPDPEPTSGEIHVMLCAEELCAKLGRPLRICLGGPSHCWESRTRLNTRLSLRRHLVFDAEIQADGPEWGEKLRAQLEAAQLCRIDLADLLIVVTPAGPGQLGMDLEREVAYAQARGVVVTSLQVPDPQGTQA